MGPDGDEHVSDLVPRSLASQSTVTTASHWTGVLPPAFPKDFDLVLLDLDFPVVGGAKTAGVLGKTGTKTPKKALRPATKEGSLRPPDVGLRAASERAGLLCALTVALAGCWGLSGESGRRSLGDRDVREGIAMSTESSASELVPVSDGGYFGFADPKSGALVLAPRFEYAWAFKHGFARVRHEGKYGFIDTAGEWVVAPEYDDTLPDLEHGFCFGLKDKKIWLLAPGRRPEKTPWAVMGWQRGPLVSVLRGKLKNRYHWDHGLLYRRRKAVGEWGIFDLRSGTMLVEPKYDYLGPLAEDAALVFVGETDDSGDPRSGRYGFIDLQGKEIAAPGFASAEGFSEGRAAVFSGRWGFIDARGEQVVEARFDRVGSFADGLASVELHGRSGYIDRSGKQVIPLLFDHAFAFGDGLAPVSRNGKWGFVDTSGREAVAVEFEEIQYAFSGGSVGVKRAGRWFLVDGSGKRLTAEDFDSLEAVGAAVIARNGSSYQLLDRRGRPLGSGSYELLGRGGERMLIARRDGLTGFLDESGALRVPLRYTQATGFYDGFAPVERDGRWGLVDVSGTEVIAPRYDYVSGVKEGFARVKSGGKYGFVFVGKAGAPTAGAQVPVERIPLRYDYVDEFVHGRARVSTGSKWRMVDREGKEHKDTGPFTPSFEG